MSEEPDEDHEVWSGEELTENEAVWSLENSGTDDKMKEIDKADWVDVADSVLNDIEFVPTLKKIRWS